MCDVCPRLKHSAGYQAELHGLLMARRGLTRTDRDHDPFPLLDRSVTGISGHGHPAHRNLSIKPHDDGDHGTTSGVSLPAESELEHRDTISYKAARG